MHRQGCSLSMIHRTCEKLHACWVGLMVWGVRLVKWCRGVRLGILSMPNSWCMPFYFKTRGVKENPITHILYIVLTYISI